MLRVKKKLITMIQMLECVDLVYSWVLRLQILISKIPLAKIFNV